jgi:hypothetical protein
MKPRPILFCHAVAVIPRRSVHHSSAKSASISAASSVASPVLQPATMAAAKRLPPLAVLPISSIIRSYAITRVTSSPILLQASFAILKRMLDPKARLLSPERNRILRWLFKHTFYAQFCSGENRAEVQRTISSVKKAGYSGVILEYALEVLKGETGSAVATAEEIEMFRKGMIESIEMVSAGDFVALKWSGLGKEALQLLDKNLPPTPEMATVLTELCDMAAKKDAALLPGAELEVTNAGIDQWTLDLQRRYNKVKKGKAIMYTTYQAYLRSTPERIARDLAIAQRDGFTLGVKLVRGAYLLSEPKDRVWSSKEETDKAYDAIVDAVLKQRYNDFLKPAGATGFPAVALLMATHNSPSVEKARAIRSEQARHGEDRIDCTYAQLQGMADEISCELIQARKSVDSKDPTVDVPRPFKCATWGTIGHCLNFLYRRAAENQDAALRTVTTRQAMGEELVRRFRGAFSRS